MHGLQVNVGADNLQFTLYDQPQGKFVKILLHGKIQKQDHLFYTAFHSVRMWGILLDENAAAAPAPVQQQPQQQANKLEEKDQCVICFEKRRDAAIIPCGHLISCMECIEDIKTRGGVCPQCRGGIISVLKVSLSLKEVT